MRYLRLLLAALLVAPPAGAAPRATARAAQPAVQAPAFSAAPAPLPALAAPRLTPLIVAQAPQTRPAALARADFAARKLQADWKELHEGTKPQAARLAQAFDGLADAESSPFLPVLIAAGQLQRYHVDHPRASGLLRRALRGMLEQGGVTTAKEASPHFRALRRAVAAGQAEGLGVSLVKPLLRHLNVVDVAPFSAAEQAGLSAGDSIVRVDGRDVRFLGTAAVKRALDRDRPVTLAVVRRTEDGRALREVSLSPSPFPRPEFRQLVLDVFEQAARTIVGSSPADLAEAALKKMGNSLDRFTEYFNAWLAREFFNKFASSYSGFGFNAGDDDGQIKVKRVLPGSPAARAGITRGDVVVAVDGKPAASLDEIIPVLKDAAAATVTVAKPDGARLEAALTAEKLSPPTAAAAMLPGNVGYVYLAAFSDAGFGRFFELVLDLRRQGARKLVVDLRNNGGGQTDSALQLARLFLRGGSTITTIEHSIQGRETSTTDAHGLLADMRLAVIVNGATASASEMFAAAMRDNGRAVIVGSRTFGKGVGQDILQLSGDRAIKITSMRWRTPAGVQLELGRGLEPDIPAPADADPLQSFDDGTTLGLDDPAVKAAWEALLPKK